MRRLSTSLFLCCLAGTAAAQADLVTELFGSIDERLGYMQEVALYKAKHGLAIEDREREQAVLVASGSAAATAGLEPDSTRSFFAAQIALAKIIQFRRRADLLSMDELPPGTDLNTGIRPALDVLGEHIIALLAATLRARGNFTETDWPVFALTVEDNYLTTREQRLLFESLLSVRLR